MNFGQLKTKALDYLYRTSNIGVSSGVEMIGDMVNMAKSNLERGVVYIGTDGIPKATPAWPHMLSKSTGVLNVSVDYISPPTRFKEFKGVFISEGTGTTKTITVLTSSGTTANATLANHGYSTGDRVIISGASPSAYNGVVNITVTGTGSFTYPITSGIVSPATGTIIAEREARQRRLESNTEWPDLVELYPYGPYSKGTPTDIAYVQEDSLFRVRPFPDDTFAYEMVTYNFTADYSSDSDSNFWTETGWDALLFETLITASSIVKDERASTWMLFRDKALASLARYTIEQNYAGRLNMKVDVTV